MLCVDEKSQIQALNRTQPGLPLKKGRCGTMTHDYQRKGTTTLFAALDLLQGKVIGDFHQRHRHQEFLSFLRRIDQNFPANRFVRGIATLKPPSLALALNILQTAAHELLVAKNRFDSD